MEFSLCIYHNNTNDANNYVYLLTWQFKIGEYKKYKLHMYYI